ncbi:MAG TPA: LacI family DNA-binding transcriptional regulator [Abditibacteriaceae bacterium]|jgi:DNA-binding LacI/PurR family transcriptional regulator
MNQLTSRRESTKHPTIHDVAEALGMHKSTVSVAFSGKGNLSVATRNKVLQVARELGYEPNPLAQRLANGVSNSLICLFSGVLDVGLATEKILLIQKELTERGLEVPIYTYSDQSEGGKTSQAAQVKQLCRQRPRAIICASQMLNHSVYDELAAYQNNGGIVVSYDIPVPLNCDQVVFDRENNAYQGASYLLSKGHRRIAIGISGPGIKPGEPLSGPHGIRMKGFERALQEFGASSELLFVDSTYERGGAALAAQFLKLKERPTGICIVNDYVALAFMTEMMRAGVRVPHDVSIIGHDDQPVADYCPVPLTAISQPVGEIAHAVVALLVERLEGSTVAPRTQNIRGKLIKRQSVVPIEK